MNKCWDNRNQTFISVTIDNVVDIYYKWNVRYFKDNNKEINQFPFNKIITEYCRTYNICYKHSDNSFYKLMPDNVDEIRKGWNTIYFDNVFSLSDFRYNEFPYKGLYNIINIRLSETAFEQLRSAVWERCSGNPGNYFNKETWTEIQKVFPKITYDD